MKSCTVQYARQTQRERLCEEREEIEEREADSQKDRQAGRLG